MSAAIHHHRTRMHAFIPVVLLALLIVPVVCWPVCLPQLVRRPRGR